MNNLDFLQDLIIPQVLPDDKELFELPIALDEVKIAIRQLNSNKCPGIDGIPIDFIKDFKND